MPTGRAPWWLGSVALGLVVVQNVLFFTLFFPGGRFAAMKPQVAEAARLPVSVDAFLPPPPPSFAATISARSVYLSADAPASRLVFRRRIDDVFPLASV